MGLPVMRKIDKIFVVDPAVPVGISPKAVPVQPVALAEPNISQYQKVTNVNDTISVEVPLAPWVEGVSTYSLTP